MLLLEIEKKDLPDAMALTGDPSLGVDVVETDNLDASGVEIIKILVPFSLAAMTAATKVVVEMLRSRKHIKIKHKGVEITGLSAENAMKVLGALAEKKKE
jgi:hypothetical protein